MSSTRYHKFERYDRRSKDYLQFLLCSLLDDEGNRCTSHHDQANHCECYRTHTTGGRKLDTLHIGNRCSLLKVRHFIIVSLDCELLINSCIISRRSSLLNKGVRSIGKTSKCWNITSSIRYLLCCIVNIINPLYTCLVGSCIYCILVICISTILDNKSCSSKRDCLLTFFIIRVWLILRYGKFRVVNLS